MINSAILFVLLGEKCILFIRDTEITEKERTKQMSLADSKYEHQVLAVTKRGVCLVRSPLFLEEDDARKFACYLVECKIEKMDRVELCFQGKVIETFQY
jgi:hypothetical protein